MYRQQQWSTSRVNFGTDVTFIAYMYLGHYTKVVHWTRDVNALCWRSNLCYYPFCGSPNYPVFVKTFSLLVIIRIATKTKWPSHWLHYTSDTYISATMWTSANMKVYSVSMLYKWEQSYNAAGSLMDIKDTGEVQSQKVVKSGIVVKACPHLIRIWSTSISHLSPLRMKLDRSTSIVSALWT